MFEDTSLIELSRTLLEAKILVVDDNEVNRIFLQKSLEKYGFKNFFPTENGGHALRAYEAISPDLMLLDIIMPEMDGYECCRKVRALPGGADIPILIQTGLNKPEERVKAFECGATDFVSKPVFPDELFSRVRVHLEKRFSMQTLKLYKQRIESELDSARELQYSILPQPSDISALESQCNLHIASYFETSSEIGGDFWGIKRLMPHQIAFWLVDFSGHGVASALNAFRLQAYMMEYSPLATRPGEYLSHLNEKLLQLLLKHHFATMFYGIIDTQGNQLIYASAGSPYPIVIRDADQTAEILDSTGKPLGISLHQYPTKMVDFKPGDKIFLYSDALIETENDIGKFLDEKTLAEWLLEPQKNPKASMEKVLKCFRQHAQQNKRDDLTIGLIQRAA